MGGGNRYIPIDPIGLAAGRDDSTLWICRRRWGLRGRRQGNLVIGKRVCRDPRLVRGDVDVVVPIRQSGVYLSIHGNIEFLWNLGIAQRVVAAQAVLIEQIRGSVLIDGQDEIAAVGLLGQQLHQAGTDVEIVFLKKLLVIRSERTDQIQHPIALVQFNHAVAVMRSPGSIEEAIAGTEVDVPGAIAGQATTRQPDCRRLDSRRCIEHANLLQCLFVVGHHPAHFRGDVATRAAESYVDRSVLQQ